MSVPPPRRSPVPPHLPQYYPVPTNSGYNSPLPPLPLLSPSTSTHDYHSPTPRYPRQQHLAPPVDLSPPNRSGSSLGRRDTAQGVARGAIGGAFGPYAHHQVVNGGRDSVFVENRFSVASSNESVQAEKRALNDAPGTTTATIPAYLWDARDPEPDDFLHNPDPVRDARLDRSFDPFSPRGWANMSVLVILVAALVGLFVGFPILRAFVHDPRPLIGFNFGGANGTGQIPVLPGVRLLIDPDTPDNVSTRMGHDGKLYNLVFSDEFNTDGRTFWPGDDPFWEAVDLYYWPTLDLEWYSPQSITTKDGKLVITMTEVLNHRLNWQSGMLQSWNKFCFTTGYIEVAVSLPGSGAVPGNWAAAWTMGNLGRAGYGATTEGMWPYSYDSCDVGTFPNQTNLDGTPAAALNSGDPRPPTNGQLSFLPGQRLSACTCPGSEHPGPTVNTGRGVPEIDVIEAQVDIPRRQGQASQSYQAAPFNAAYEFVNTSDATPIYDPTITAFNHYKGGKYQQAISGVTMLDNTNYGGNGYQTYGFEYWSDPSHRDQGYVTWFVGQTASWTMNAAAIGADTATGIKQRLISEEPMSIIINFGMSPGFQGQDFANLKFPQQMFVDYVRVYQRADQPINVGCDPASRPTAKYIEKHIVAYTNPNLTTWDQANFSFPRNSIYNGC